MISKRRLRVTRDGTLFVIGILGIAHETLVSKTDRPSLLLLFAGMVGLPAFLYRDEKLQVESKEGSRADDAPR